MVSFGIGIPEARYDSEAKKLRFHERLIRELEAIPGVSAVGAGTGFRLTGSISQSASFRRVSESILLSAAGLLVLWQGVELRLRGRTVAAADDFVTEYSGKRMLVGGGMGLAVGLLGGAVGLILGSIRLPALIRILRVDPRIAAGSNLFIGFIMGSLGWIGHVARGQVDYALLIPMAAAAMVGSYYGAKLTGRVRLDTLITVMGGVLVVVGALLVWQAFR